MLSRVRRILGDRSATRAEGAAWGKPWALADAGITTGSELALDTMLQRVVDAARNLIGARYGALSWLDEEGNISDLVTSGLTEEEIRQIGPMPKGHGLLGLVITEGQSLRLDDLRQHPRSVGFPDNHPPMRSLLAVPITIHGYIFGNLYLSETLSGRPFDERDERILRKFAMRAAVVLLNARLVRQAHAVAIATERERIARELHDSVAQVLGYVITKSQAASTHLANGNRDAAIQHLEQLSAAAHSAYGDVRENILGLRAAASPDLDLHTALMDYLETWQDHAGIPVTLKVLTDDVPNAMRRYPETTRLQVLRIVQEAVSNVRKHARATAVRVTVSVDAGAMTLRIADNGRGFDTHILQPSGQPRFGLAIMRERAEAIGGTFDVATSPSGTTVTVTVAISQEAMV